jgi:Rrf2 family protein
MAQHSERSHIVPEIAAATKVPPGYLCKVLQILSRAKLVSSQRGLGGGFSLMKTPTQISMFDVIHAVDPIQHNQSCPLKLRSHSLPLCLLHRRLNDVILTTEKNFRSIAISDLMHLNDTEKTIYTFPCKCHSVTPLNLDSTQALNPTASPIPPERFID